ncbi:hypothetical protein BDDG_09921 [Blastomyces dermatitidis ATCC 18188]|uniref:Uncharacterized protein n=1 Tax=Ajellomyces dermatitidis (strain ATCC 18188 / CBS 674.68) TaxID=653446 RepID=F2TUQ7_AJEDA|nr:hypothetical protein BDDG_09921 [Blastomyces dermatitidis ATCC 18188]EQL29425.1 hypothetical protein BDFG_07969 [Blastomyces dermatitidis ATCC 26199]
MTSCSSGDMSFALLIINNMTVSKTVPPPFIRIVTLNFDVQEISHGRAGIGRVVWIVDLPPWKIRFDRVSVRWTWFEVVRDDRAKRRQLLRRWTAEGFAIDTCDILSFAKLVTCTCGSHPSMHAHEDQSAPCL